jgi:hypothetical protein
MLNMSVVTLPMATSGIVALTNALKLIAPSGNGKSNAKIAFENVQYWRNKIYSFLSPDEATSYSDPLFGQPVRETIKPAFNTSQMVRASINIDGKTLLNAVVPLLANQMEKDMFNNGGRPDTGRTLPPTAWKP